MRFAEPLMLLALIPIAAIAVAVELRAPRRRSTRARVAGALRYVSLVLLVLALADPRLGDGPAEPTVVIVDRSASVDQRAREIERDWLEVADDNELASAFGAVRFAGGAELTSPVEAAEDDAGGLRRRETDLAAALRLAIGRLPAGGRIVALSDGFETAGDALSVTGAARERDVRIDAVPLTDTRPDAGIARLDTPPVVRAGDTTTLQVTVRSTIAGPAVLSMRRDGGPIRRQRVRLRAGDNPFLLTPRAPSPGGYAYEVRVRVAGDRVAENDALSAAVRVRRPPRALVATTGRSTLPATLRADGVRVQALDPTQLPDEPDAYRNHDAVVLDDVPAPELGDARASALTEAVRTDGLGLLAFGGEDSFSAGRYADSPLQQALPVRSLRPGKRRRRNLALEIVLDRSGSMAESAGGASKIGMAKAAARAATGLAAERRDEIGVVSFDIAPRTLVELTAVEPGAAAAAVNRQIDRLRAAGGTDVHRALRAGLRQLGASQQRNRHMILLSDGVSEDADYAPLLERLSGERISVSTVALGDEADTRLLRTIATRTGGRYHATRDASDLPRIFARDIRRARPVRLRGRIAVTQGATSPIVRSLGAEELPRLRRNIVTRLRPGAQADLLGENKGRPRDPVLAHWQYGLGRVVAWTPGLAPESAGQWIREVRLWRDATRWAARSATLLSLAPRLAPGPSRILEVDPVRNAGTTIDLARLVGSLGSPERSIPLRFSQTAPSRYVAPIPSLAPGTYRYAIAADRGAPAARGLVAIPYAEEYRPLAPDASPLGALTEATGGSLLDPAESDAIAGEDTGAWWWLAAGALASFLAGVAVRMLGDRPAPPPAPGSDRPQASLRTTSAARAASKSRSIGATRVDART